MWNYVFVWRVFGQDGMVFVTMWLRRDVHANRPVFKNFDIIRFRNRNSITTVLISRHFELFFTNRGNGLRRMLWRQIRAPRLDQ